MNSNNTKILTFHVSGMHCAACTLLLEETFMELPNVSEVKVSLKNHQVIITGDFSGTPEETAVMLSNLVKGHGYTLSVEKVKKESGWGDFSYAIPISVAIILGFIFLQKAGLTNFINSSEVSYGTAFIIGLIAS